jgi:hypothetical protein
MLSEFSPKKYQKVVDKNDTLTFNLSHQGLKQ